jgi:molecular chaperone GrpE
VNETLPVNDTSNVNETLKETLVEQFRAHLDALDTLGGETANDLSGQEDSATDLRSLFVELAALRTEVRTESRLVKDTLDLVRGTVARAETERGAAAREAERIRGEARQREKALLRPLLTDLLEVRDRLAAGVSGPVSAPAPVLWYRRVFRRSAADATTGAEAWREGLRMALARFDRVLGDRGVVPLDPVGRPFDPKTARAVGTVTDPSRDNGIVAQEVRSGFLWEGELLRAADVIVNKVLNKTAREEGEPA